MPIAFERHGSGPPLVLVHGLGHRRQAWDAVLDLLTPHREVIIPDLPGHGESQPLELAGKQPVRAMADQIIALLDELGLRRPHVAGNSLGGALALVLAADGRASSVTGLSPAGFWRSDLEIGYARAVFTASWAAGRAIMPLVPAMSRSAAGRGLLYGTMVARPGRITPEQARGDVPAFVAARPATRLVFAAPEQFVSSVRADVPVTIAWGAKDRVLPASGAKIARQRIPHATFVRLPGCGHVPMTDDPGLVAKVLLTGSDHPENTSGA